MIPNHIHFIYFQGDKPFSLVHHLAVASARARNPDARITIHCDYPPDTPSWIAGLRGIEEVDVVITDRPTHIYGVPLLHPAHQADVKRLELMLTEGGIYLDLDVICLRPFTDLLGRRMVLARQDSAGEKGLGCATMLAEANTPLVKRWIEGYDPQRSLWKGFRSKGRDTHWSEMSTRYPRMLAQLHPDEIEVLEYQAFYPFGFDQGSLRKLFVDKAPVPAAAYSIHLWEARSWEVYLADLTPSALLASGSTFAELVSPYLGRR